MHLPYVPQLSQNVNHSDWDVTVAWHSLIAPTVYSA